jgi:CRP/FNR family transcriptional regulator
LFAAGLARLLYLASNPAARHSVGRNIMTTRSPRHALESPEGGLTLRAIPFFESATGNATTRLLTPREREDLTRIAMRLRLPARMALYRENAQAKWIFVITQGVVKVFRDLPSGKRRVLAFLFAGDMFGLAEGGRYVNSAQTITPGTLYRLPVDELMEVLRHDAKLEFQVLCKLTHEVREAQQRGMILSRRDAAGRVAMFLRCLQKSAHTPGSHHDTISLPMTRSDIADYLALSLEAVSRACADLERRGILRFERQLACVLNQPRLTKLAESC